MYETGGVIDPITLISHSRSASAAPAKRKEIIWAEIIARLVVSTVCRVYVLRRGGWLRGRTHRQMEEGEAGCRDGLRG